MKKKIKSLTSKGATSTILLVLGVVLIVVIIMVFVVIRLNATKSPNNSPSPDASVTPEVPKPVYETTIGDTKFIFESAQDLGNILASKYGYQQSLHTTEKYIRVTLGVQNKGKVNIDQESWSLGNIIDSDGRNFVSIDNQAYEFMPTPNLCGSIIKPEFAPVPCVRYYEVSRASTNLKIEVKAAATSGSTTKGESFIDLLVTP